jgi:hypothetical protein
MRGKLSMLITKSKEDAIVNLRNTLAQVAVDPAILGYLSDEQAKAVMKALLHLVNNEHDRI